MEITIDNKITQTSLILEEIISVLERVKTFMKDPQQNEYNILAFHTYGTEIEIDLHRNDVISFVVNNDLIKIVEIQKSTKYRNESIILIDKIEHINLYKKGVDYI